MAEKLFEHQWLGSLARQEDDRRLASRDTIAF